MREGLSDNAKWLWEATKLKTMLHNKVFKSIFGGVVSRYFFFETFVKDR